MTCGDVGGSAGISRPPDALLLYPETDTEPWRVSAAFDTCLLPFWWEAAEKNDQHAETERGRTSRCLAEGCCGLICL